MLKKIAYLTLGVVVVGSLWNWTRVVAASEKVRDAWIESQKSQTLEDWELHFKRQLRAMRGKVEKMERQARSEALASEVAKLRSERIARTVDQSTALVTAFKSQIEAKQNFVFAGQNYDTTLAAVQLKRFEGELAALGKRAEAAKAQADAHTRASGQYTKAAAALQSQIVKLEERGRQLAVRRQMMENRRRIQELEERKADVEVDEAPLNELRSLVEVAEEALDQIEARHRIEARKRPAKTRSLSDSLSAATY